MIVLEFIVEVIHLKGWRNGYLGQLVEAARREEIAWEYIDLPKKKLEELRTEFGV